MEFDFDSYFKNYVYEPIDLCACYFPEEKPPVFLWDEPGLPFHTMIERKIGNTWYTIQTECSGTERLTDKVKRLIFSEREVI